MKSKVGANKNLWCTALDHVALTPKNVSHKNVVIQTMARNGKVIFGNTTEYHWMACLISLQNGMV
jgi:hypothetical protein